MKRLQFTTTIQAPKEKVWKTMLDDATYREWTKAFSEGSYYEGSWEAGNEIRFLGPDPETGQLGGMFSMVRESRPYEYVSVEHVGLIADGVVDTTSDMVKQWTPAFENYTFRDKDGGTQLLVELDTADDFAEMFQDTWPEALEKLKALAEAK